MISNKAKIIGNLEDHNRRKYIAIRKNGDLIIKVLASEEDKNNIENYDSNCVTDIDERISSFNIRMNHFFNLYVKYISEEFEKENDDFHRFITNFVYAYRIEKILLNDYNRFLKNNIMFSYWLKIDEILEDGKLFKFKI